VKGEEWFNDGKVSRGVVSVGDTGISIHFYFKPVRNYTIFQKNLNLYIPKLEKLPEKGVYF
jgi:hypothetical protein